MNRLWIFLFLAITILTNCDSFEKNQPKSPTPAKSISDYFQLIEPADTFLFEINETEEKQWADTLPNGLFFSKMETQLMNGIEYFDNTGKLTVIGRTRFSFGNNLDAYLVDLRQNWYRHLSLFIFDPQKEQFVHRETVAEFYGGDGGQILTGSWLVGPHEDGARDLIRQEVEHWIIIDEDDTRDTLTKRATLLTWEGNNFLEKKENSEALVKQFPIKLFW